MATFAEPCIGSAAASLARDGFCVIEDVLGDDTLAEMRDSIYRIVAFDRAEGWTRRYPYGREGGNQRVWNLPSRDPLFCRLIEHERALRFVKQLIGWPALLSSSSANIVVTGGHDEAVHADQCYMPEPWAQPHGVNIAWAIDAFREENGATMVAPGSHLLNRSSRADEAMPRFVPIEAAAGSMIALDGRLWHSTGRNCCGRPRAGIFNWYTLPIYLPQENWFLSLNPALRQFGSETLQTLFGFRAGILGRVNGLEPGQL